jgi:hypothetical protein
MLHASVSGGLSNVSKSSSLKHLRVSRPPSAVNLSGDGTSTHLCSCGSHLGWHRCSLLNEPAVSGRLKIRKVITAVRVMRAWPQRVVDKMSSSVHSSWSSLLANVPTMAGADDISDGTCSNRDHLPVSARASAASTVMRPPAIRLLSDSCDSHHNAHLSPPLVRRLNSRFSNATQTTMCKRCACTTRHFTAHRSPDNHYTITLVIYLLAKCMLTMHVHV